MGLKIRKWQVLAIFRGERKQWLVLLKNLEYFKIWTI